MENAFTIVTSLYNLSEVERDDNRDWETYLEWFSKTLQIKCPFIIFTEENLSQFIRKHRENLPTHIIEQPFNEIPLYHLKDDIQNILDSEEYKSQMLDIDRVECKDSLYSVIQYSKFKWIQKASEVNPFDSKYFFWLDAGASRFIDAEDIQNTYPSREALSVLEDIDNTLLIQYNHEYYSDLVESKNISQDYFWDNRSFVCGSMFGGTAESINLINSEIDNIMDYMITNKCINNEQISLGYLCKKKKDLFTRFYRTNPADHLSLFQEMA